MSKGVPDLLSHYYEEAKGPFLNLSDLSFDEAEAITLVELPAIIEKYGLPNEWNKEGKFGPERYIEVQIWDDQPIKDYLQSLKKEK